jgi:hypothetical protein
VSEVGQFRRANPNVTCLRLRSVSLSFSVCTGKEPQTISCLRSTPPFLVIVLICQVLVSASSAYSQGPATIVPDQYVLPAPGDLRAFNSFIEFVGNEDDRNQKATQDRRAQTTGRTNYATAIPVGKDEEQAMLTTLLDAYRRDKEVDGRLGCHSGERVNELNNLYGPTGASKMIGDELEACSKEKFPIAEAAWLRLKDELGADSFRGFNQYVNQRLWIRVAQHDPNPCPANYNPPSGQTTHLACTMFYEDFFEDFVRTNIWNKAMIQEGRNADTQVFSTFIPLPETTKQAVISLGLDAARDITEAHEEARTRVGKFIDDNGVKYDARAQMYHLPPEIEALNEKPTAIVEEYIAKLRQVLGEELFWQFDKILSSENNTIFGSIAAPSANGTPAGQGPGVAQ